MQSSREILDRWWNRYAPFLEDELLTQVNNLKAANDGLKSEVKALKDENVRLKAKL